MAQQFPDALPAALARHHAILRDAIETHGGYVFQIIGDAFCAAFATAPNALAATRVAQRALHTEPWGATGPIRVRMGVHTGEAEWRDGAYHGYLTQMRVQRVMSAGHGGQILLSQTTHDLIRDQLAPDISLRDMGEHRLKGLERLERIFQVVAPDLPSDFPSLQTLNAIPHNLPIQLTSFVGREKEIAEVKRLLSITRLLTLTGVGGTGKTRLSLQVAADMLDTFKDGAWLIELAPLADPNLVPQTVATVLGVREAQGRALLATLSDYLHAKNLLLILDNCEHLLEACAQFADAILHTCPNVRLLASSREPLGIAGEQAFHVPSLSVPDPRDVNVGARLSGASDHALDHDGQPRLGQPQGLPLQQYEAVRLFLDRACAVKSDFALTNVNASAIAQICFRLDGIPLAIELAAARVKSLSVDDIATRLHNQFRLLTGGSRTSLPRQQTLKALIDWSYNLLTEPERVLFRRLSVFAGGWTLAAAEQVCSGEGLALDEVVDVLDHLVSKSLVLVDTQGTDTRYRMLETIRQHAGEKLMESAEGEAVGDRHLVFFLNLAEEAEPKLLSTEQVVWFNRLETEHDNLRAAIKWSQERGEVLAGLRFAGALYNFWSLHGHHNEGLARFNEVLSRPEAMKRTAVRAKALNFAGWMQWAQGNNTEADSLLKEALAIASELADKSIIAQSLSYLGLVAHSRNDFPTAHSFLEKSLTLWQELGDKRGISSSLLFAGTVAMRQGNHQRAKMLYEESMSIQNELGDKLAITVLLRRLGQVALYQGEYDKATALCKQSLMLNLKLADTRAIAACLVTLAAVSAARGQTMYATQLLGAVDALLASTHSRLFLFDRELYDRNLATLRAQLSEATFIRAWAEGHALSMEQAIQLAMELESLGR